MCYILGVLCFERLTHPEEDDDEHGNSGVALDRADDGGASNGESSVDGEEEVGLEDGAETGCDEATDGESDEGVGKHLRALLLVKVTVGLGVVDEESTASDLSTDVAELRHETEDHVVLLVEGAGADDLAIGISRELDSGVVDDGSAALNARALGDLRELGEEEEDADGGAQAGDGEVDELNVGQVVLVGAGEEGLAGNERTGDWDLVLV